MNEDAERTLIQRAKRDPDAFRALYRAYVGRVFAYVAYRVARREDAEDLTSDIFMQVFRHLVRFEHRGEGSFAAWLFRIAHNVVVNHVARQPATYLALDDVPEIGDGAPQPEQAIADKERFLRLYNAIAQLSPRRQEIVRLRYFAGLRNQQIAAVLALDERTVAAHLSRALDDLQAALTDAASQENL